jgi:hypothetical protein
MMNDVLHGTGMFHVEVIDVSTDQVLETYEEKNLVVTLGKTNITKLLGGDAAGKKISKIAIGTGSVQPAVTDTTLTDIFSKLISGVSYPDSNSVLFSWSLETTEGNGLTIREFGLLNDDGVLCARKVRTDIVKTSAVRLVGTWKVSIN